ncbi:MAG: riboflavin biosynthesis protein RibF [Muribaculaceae bacterium]|nr:riboflavin biosynthesis protein RibF [Muribaculaceae bacterium]
MKKRVAAIGTFDGVHTGHLSVLKALTRYAGENDMEPVAITFKKHPLAVIDPSRIPTELTPLWKKKKLLQEVGAMPLVLDFDEPMRATTAREWMKRLRDEFQVMALVIGYDNTFGCDGINLSLEDYKIIGNEEGIEVLTAEEIKGVSSSSIRKAVKAGEMETAQKMLGRPFSITAQVVTGNGLGHTIGFPTANIDVPKGAALPKPGVYAGIVKTLDDGVKHPAMINIGTRPTVMRGNDTVIEAHVINWNGDLYGKDITVRFLKRLRDEQKFNSIDALKNQLALDRSNSLEIATQPSSK